MCRPFVEFPEGTDLTTQIANRQVEWEVLQKLKVSESCQSHPCLLFPIVPSVVISRNCYLHTHRRRLRPEALGPRPEDAHDALGRARAPLARRTGCRSCTCSAQRERQRGTGPCVHTAVARRRPAGRASSGNAVRLASRFKRRTRGIHALTRRAEPPRARAHERRLGHQTRF